MSLSAQIKRIKANDTKLVTPRVDAWLINHPEGIVIPDTPEWRDLVMMLLSSPNSDRSKRFGASGRGRCERRQVFDFLGMPGLRALDPVLQNLFNDGTFRHIRHQLMGLVGGWFTGVEVTHVLPQYHLKVSTDAENADEGWGFELKGMSWMKKLLTEGISDYHMGQIHTYFAATNYDRFVYFAEHKQSNDWMEIVVVKDPVWMKKVKDELNALSDAIEDERLPAVLSGCKAHKGDDFRGCPYSGNCPAQDEWPKAGKWTI